MNSYFMGSPLAIQGSTVTYVTFSCKYLEFPEAYGSFMKTIKKMSMVVEICKFLSCLHYHCAFPQFCVSILGEMTYGSNTPRFIRKSSNSKLRIKYFNRQKGFITISVSQVDCWKKGTILFLFQFLKRSDGWFVNTSQTSKVCRIIQITSRQNQ